MINFNIDPSEFNKSIEKLVDEAYSKIDFNKIYNGIGAVMQLAIEDQFDSEGAYFGSKWAPLAPSTIKQRERLKKWPGNILDRNSGGLRSSFTYSLTGSTLTFGTNKSYAKYLHHGTKYMPARPLFSVLLTEDMKEEIRRVISLSLS